MYRTQGSHVMCISSGTINTQNSHIMRISSGMLRAQGSHVMYILSVNNLNGTERKAKVISTQSLMNNEEIRCSRTRIKG